MLVIQSTLIGAQGIAMPLGSLAAGERRADSRVAVQVEVGFERPGASGALDLLLAGDMIEEIDNFQWGER